MRRKRTATRHGHAVTRILSRPCATSASPISDKPGMAAAFPAVPMDDDVLNPQVCTWLVINSYCAAAPNPICPGDSGGTAGFLTKPYKIEEVQIL